MISERENLHKTAMHGSLESIHGVTERKKLTLEKFSFS